MNFSFPFHLDRATLVRGTAVCTLMVAATMLYLWQHMVMVDLGYHIERSRTELAKLSHQRVELLVEVASLSSLARIEHMARTQLDMVQPRPQQLVRVMPASSVAPKGNPEGHLLLAANTLPSP
jgi:cell division protein FtsL